MDINDTTLFWIAIIIGASYAIITDNPNEYDIQEDDAYLVGADGYNIHLINNPNATDASYSELMNFLKYDKTNEIPYDINTFVCSDYSELLHNNAEKSGIKAGVVSIGFIDNQDGHMFNIFNTIDNGYIFIDEAGGYDSTIKSFSVGNKIVYDENMYISDDNIISDIDFYW